METLKFTCPSCKSILRAPLDQAGKTAPCPHCRHKVTAPLEQKEPSKQQLQEPPPKSTPSFLRFCIPFCSILAIALWTFLCIKTPLFFKGPHPEVISLPEAPPLPKEDLNQSTTKEKDTLQGRGLTGFEKIILEAAFDSDSSADLTSSTDSLPSPLSDSEPLIPETDQANSSVYRFLTAFPYENRAPYTHFEGLDPNFDPHQSLLTKKFPKAEFWKDTSEHYPSYQKGSSKIFEIKFTRKLPQLAQHFSILVLRNEETKTFQVSAPIFLENLSERLKKFLNNPSPASLRVHTLVTPFEFCFHDIPNPKQFSYLQLKGYRSDQSPHFAYFHHDKEIAQKIIQSQHHSWGTTFPATILLKWNLSSPAQPFVELIKIESFRWD